jgi:histidinol dehydrogenase
MTLPLLDMTDSDDRRRLEALIGRLKSQAAPSGELAESVAAIVDEVRQRGDAAVAGYMQRWTDPNFDTGRMRVTTDEMAAAEASLNPKVRAALKQAIENVRAYQQHILPTDPPTFSHDGAELGLRFTPMRRVGLAVPGGKAAYPSTVIMTAVPAQVAGVSQLAVICPPPTASGNGDKPAADVSPLVLGTCHLLNVDEVYRVGGAQGIAALAFGTQTIPAVDFIAGPGNAFVQQAKRQVFGTVGIDGFYGPSEIVVLVDQTATSPPVAAAIAADLLAQAEHDPGSCYLVGWQREALDAVIDEVNKQLPQRKRRAAIEPALNDWSCATLCESRAAALQLVDRLAGEHVTLAVADAEATLNQLSHGGAWFLGAGSPVASGDYYAGPSHCLPTGTTARFTSGISVYTFLKRSSVERYPVRPPGHAIDHIAALAEAEGLDAHAASVRARRDLD